MKTTILLAISVCLFLLQSTAQANECVSAYEVGKKTNDFAIVYEKCLPMAQQGDAPAQTILGLMYFNGQGVAKNDATAVTWYRRAAEQGYAGAQNNLGLMYFNGRGVAKNDATALAWFIKAAEQGDASAQNNLGFMYEEGRGVTKDEARAVAWYRKAAEQGNEAAQNHLGIMYRNGRGVAKDEAIAVAWYTKAAEQGDASAQNNLGFMYEEGRGVTKDEARAVAWYTKAAEQGNSRAVDNINNLLETADRYAVLQDKTPVFEKPNSKNAKFFLKKDALVVLFGAKAQGKVFVFYNTKNEQLGWVDPKFLRNETARIAQQAAARLKNFRASIKTGLETNCGPVLETKGDLVKVYFPVAQYGNEHWIKRNQLYPADKECNFVNGRYTDE